MDEHTLKVLEYEEVKTLLRSYTSSPLARAVIKSLRPSRDRDRLSLSLKQVDEARALLDAGRRIPTAGLRDMTQVVRGAHRQSRALGPEELMVVRTMIVSCKNLYRFFGEVADAAPALVALAERLIDHTDLLDAIDAVVEAPGEVLDRASPRLWDLRRKRKDLEERVRDRMTELATGKRYRAFLQERTWSLRNGRYVLMVRADSRGHVPGILHDKSASGETAFVEPHDVVAQTNALADLRLDEDREVTRLLLELSQRVYAEEDRLAYTQNVAAWLDFTEVRARMSADLNLVPARLADEPVFRLRHGRHPLLLLSERRGTLGHPVVPVSLTLGEVYRMMVITGPNTGGKTVALKALGLIQLMFQSGLHVPAAPGTELPCLASIHADIGDEQSLSQNLSTFSGHVRNTVKILEGAGPDSLVLLDELGAGTDPGEGAALGRAILDELLRLGSCVVVTTHLGSLKGYAFAHPEVENASVAFDPETLEPTYELVVGQPGASQALLIAERQGMPAVVVNRARALAADEKGEAEELMKQLMTSRMAAERSRRQSESMVEESKRKLDAAEGSLREAESSRGRIEQEAESEVARLLADFNRAAQPHVNALRNVPKALVPHLKALEELLANRLHTQTFAARRREFLRDLKKHDQVYVPRFGQVCRIEKLHRTDEQLTVKVGAISMQIAFDDVSWVTPPELPAT